MVIEQQQWRFYDGGIDAWEDQPEVPPAPGTDARIELIRMTTAKGGEEFVMMRRIAYLDRHLGILLVPPATRRFKTDLTSVPAIFTWLVPKTGAHLPATLLHDGLVHGPDETPTYTADPPHRVLRHEADRVLRDAMADTGTGIVRRWLIWSAVTAATMWDGRVNDWSAATRLYYRVVLVGLLGAVLGLGFLATTDLFDVEWFWALPWMDHRDWYVELAGGLSGAVVIPAVLGVSWRQFWKAGIIVGVALALLVHATLLLGLLTLGYQLLERAARWKPWLTGLAALVIAGAAFGFFLGLLL